tara:strand:+ start:4671 stop:5315 length:645 start_codon:yes stop_codon:yes gene_type:complete
MKTQLIEMDVKDLIKADWNYKSDGTDEQIEKLMNSINVDNSVGVLAVREINNKFEVIDGNHRLEAVIRLNWEKVPCENFGEISKGKAITIARRRNHKWFEDDLLQYAQIFKEDVVPEFTMDELADFMPDSLEDMENLLKMDEFDWTELPEEKPVYDEGLKTINIKVPESVYDIWLEWKQLLIEKSSIDTDSKAFEFAIVEALNSSPQIESEPNE